ncbi:MAG TPA: helix-turn-helix domain-containing protein [Vitreimonas sp.]|nr:helix-turn-helix domain-containing protein [Vitreimonas sp.]
MHKPKLQQDLSACPVAKAAQLIGDIWVILIVKELLNGPRRFSQLESAINGTEPIGDISTRTLSQRLKMLEEIGILSRITYKVTPPHSEYSLTDKGQALSPVIDSIRQYGQMFLS